MAILKCKMCGGDLNIIEGETVAVCEYCDTKQTVPTADNEKKMTLFARANRLRAACEFDKAAGIYESIVADFPEEAEAYWGLVLCKFGIEYVDDPATGKKIPTCHRSSFDSIMDDSDFEQVMENADAIARRVYREEAKAIEELRKNIIEVSSKEEPYDIFICYKETDENGSRTIDSVIAQDVYDALTEKGYKVFFSRITLEDKLGQEYEPYIFAALNSAKVMLAFGTDYEYYNAVWVKNEWSRFLALIAKGEKKTLIPCYKDIDAYDMPKEFRRLQAQDMGKVGATQDLLRGINKIIPKEKPERLVKETVGVQSEPKAAPLVTRAFLFLEDREWNSAKEYCNKALDIAPECGEAYLGLALVNKKIPSKKAFAEAYIQCEDINAFTEGIDKELKRSKQFSNDDLLDWFNELDLKHSERKARELECKVKKLSSDRKNLNQYRGFIATSNEYTVGMKDDGTVVAVGNNDEGGCIVSKWRDVVAIAVGNCHTVGLKLDGTVVAVGCNYDGRCNVSGWRDIVAIAAGNNHTIGLKSDGTVVATGDNEDGQCNISKWTNIVSIEGGFYFTIGLKPDGKVVAVGKNNDNRCNVSEWSEILVVSASYNHTVGLKTDGTVVAVGDNYFGQCNISDWRDIVDVIAGEYYTVGLKSDGTVVAAGKNDKGQCNTSGWTDIVAVAVGKNHTVGLKSDGTAVAVGKNDGGQCNVSSWRDIVAISASYCHTVGLKSNGTVVSKGYNYDGRCNVAGWKIFRNKSEKDADYHLACTLEKSVGETDLSKAVEIFNGLRDYKDSVEHARKCAKTFEEIKNAREKRELEEMKRRHIEETARKEREREEEERKRVEEVARAERERKDTERRRAEEAARKEKERTEKNVSLNAEKTTLQNELSNLRGFFSGKRRKQIEARLAEIDKELKNYK